MNGKLCRDSVNDRGEVQRECVDDSTPTPRARTKAPANPKVEEAWEAPRAESRTPPKSEPLAQGVGDVVAQGGFAIIAASSGTSAFTGLFGFSASGGAVFRPGVGLVGLLLANFAPLGNLGVLQFWTFGPALRVGKTHHLTVGLMPTLTSVPLNGGSTLVGAIGALVVQAAAVFDHFTMLLQPVLNFSAGGVIFTLTGGLGVAF